MLAVTIKQFSKSRSCCFSLETCSLKGSDFVVTSLRSVLMEFEFSTKGTPHFYCPKPYQAICVSVKSPKKQGRDAWIEWHRGQFKVCIWQFSGALAGVSCSGQPFPARTSFGASDSTQSRQQYGSRPFSLAVSIRLKICSWP